MRPPRTTPATGAPAAVARPAPPTRGRRAHAGQPADERGGRATGQRPGADDRPVPRGHRSLRPRTVRAKIISLLMVPVVSLLALWGFATVGTAQDVARIRQTQRVDTLVRSPVAAAVTALQAERTAALDRLLAPDAGHATALEQRAERTDSALDRLRLGEKYTVADAGNVPAELADRLDAFLDSAQKLRALRTRLLDPPASKPEDRRSDARADQGATYAQYTETITAAFAVSGALTTIQDAASGAGARVRLELGRAGEMLAREDALLGAATLDKSLEGERLRLFTGAVATRRALAETAGADLPAAGRTAWKSLTDRGAYRRIEAAEDKVLAAPAGRRAAQAVPAAEWERDVATVRGGLRSLASGAGEGTADPSGPVARALFSPGGAAVFFGFAAVAASLVISVRIGRALVVELVSLRNSALEVARRKLPRAMGRLKAGEELDIEAEAPLGRTANDEIGQVGEALDTMHRAALSAAVERAELAGGISGVFVNLARRSQVLVHRQLTLLDGMERRADDPGELGDLFRLDHLTTRMRRHAESLIILSGAAPGRAWRMPVPLTNVVRAAVSEIEDYARVELRRLPDAGVKGTAVADLTHLLAELVENAAQFSPPHTKVRISGEPVGNGYVLEIEDRGLGMGKELLGEANRRIEQTEALDLFDSDRLGLFVVSRLSARHHIKVQLRTSAYGGTTAVVLLPTDLLQSGPPTEQTHPTAEDAVAAKAAVAHEDDGPVPGSGPRPVRTPAPAFPAPFAVPALEPPPAREPHRRSAPVTALHRGTRPTPGERTEPGRAQSTDLTGTSDDSELPRRVRQASLVPQLREESPPEPPERLEPTEPPEPPESTADGSVPVAGRSPEQVRDRMTAYRDGWLRGTGSTPGTTTRPPTEGDHA